MHSEGRYGLERGLVGWWRLMADYGGVSDLIGSNDAILNGANLSGAGGRQFATFDGVNDYLTVDSGFAGLVGAERFTYSCWLYQNNTADAIIFDRNQAAGAGRRLLYIYRYLGNIRVNLGDSDETYFSGATVFPATTWTHMVVAWDKDLNTGKPRCYFNGTEVSAYTLNTARTTALPSTSDTMYVGLHSDGSTLPYPGRMSDLRIYNRALSAAEIARLARIY